MQTDNPITSLDSLNPGAQYENAPVAGPVFQRDAPVPAAARHPHPKVTLPRVAGPPHRAIWQQMSKHMQS